MQTDETALGMFTIAVIITAVFLTVLWLRPRLALFGIGGLLLMAGLYAFGDMADSAMHESIAVNLALGGLTLVGLGCVCGLLVEIRAQAVTATAQLRASAGLSSKWDTVKETSVRDQPAGLFRDGRVVVRTENGDFHFADRSEAWLETPPCKADAREERRRISAARSG